MHFEGVVNFKFQYAHVAGVVVGVAVVEQPEGCTRRERKSLVNKILVRKKK